MPLGIGFIARAMPRRARKGLFAGRQIMAGNIITEKSNQKVKRLFKPNVVDAKLYSEALQKRIKMKVTTAALRLIDRCGGLDSYLIRTPDKRLFSDLGSTLKYQIGQIYKQRRIDEIARKKQELDELRRAKTIEILSS